MAGMTVDEFSPAVEKILDQFLRDVQGDMRAAVQEGGRAAVDFLKANSPRGSGEYAQGWRYRTEAGLGPTGYYVRVFQAAKPSLTHLLEFGHREYDFGGNATGGTVAGHPHIEPAADVAAQVIVREASR